MKNDAICPVCNNFMRSIAEERLLCKVCKYMFSSEQPGAMVEELLLEPIREKNFRHICKVIKENFSQAKTILDVGCSKGFFLKIAQEEGFLPTGLEPTVQLAEKTRASGFNVINGFFPDTKALANQKYDIIIFNDSLEHIPDIQKALQGIEEHLTNEGIAIINIPTSDGFIFKTASILDKLRIKSPLNRMWQKGFASPHVHYFNLRNLKKLFEKNDFVMLLNSSLPYFTIKGLWKRISYNSPFFISIFTWLFMVLLYPLLLIRSDSFVAYFSRSKK